MWNVTSEWAGYINWLLIPLLALFTGGLAWLWDLVTRSARKRQHKNDEYYDATTNRWY